MNVGSDGSDGAFNPQSDVTIDLSEASAASWDRPSPDPGKGVYDADEWAVVFILAVNSGLRRTELRTLTWGSVFIDDDSPSVVVRSGYSKHRKGRGGRDERVDIHVDVAAELREWRDGLDRSGPDDPVFPSLKKHTKNAKAVRIYCEAAGIPYRTQDGRATFHSARHCFATRMDEFGIDESVRMEQGRWVRRDMLDNYTSVRRPRIRKAIEAMPAIVGSAAEPQDLRATGTDDAMPKKGRTKIALSHAHDAHHAHSDRG